MSTNLAEYYRGEQAAARAGTDDQEPAARAAAVHAALAPLLTGDGDTACHAGCAHCCHFPVGVTFGEALLLAQALDPAMASHALAEAAATGGLGWSALVGRACPLLDDVGRCRVYAQRPLPCRALRSRDADACAAALLGAADVPRDETAFWRGLGAAAALGASSGLGTRELRSALAAVLAGGAATADARFQAARPIG